MGLANDTKNLANNLTLIQDPKDKANVSLTLDLTFEVSVVNDNRYPVKVEEIILDVRPFLYFTFLKLTTMLIFL